MDPQQPTQPPPTNPTPPPSLPQPHSKLPLLLRGLFISLLILGGSYFVFGTKKNMTPTPTVTQTPPTAIPTTNSTANWKTYTNTLLGISIKFPPNMTLSEYSSFDSGPDVIGKYRLAVIKSLQQNNEYSFEFLISYFDSNLPLDEWYNSMKTKLINPSDEVTTSNILLNNTSAIKQARKNSMTPGFKSEEIYLSYNNQIIEISGSSIADMEDQQIFNQILSTFTFLDQNQVSPTITTDNFNWKTYTNEKYRFQFQYPPKGVIDNGYGKKQECDLTSVINGEETIGGNILLIKYPFYTLRIENTSYTNINNYINDLADNIYDVFPIQNSNADDAVKIRLKDNGWNKEGYPPLSYVTSIYLKNSRLFFWMGWQNIPAQECVVDFSDNSEIPNQIVKTFKFLE